MYLPGFFSSKENPPVRPLYFPRLDFAFAITVLSPSIISTCASTMGAWVNTFDTWAITMSDCFVVVESCAETGAKRDWAASRKPAATRDCFINMGECCLVVLL